MSRLGDIARRGLGIAELSGRERSALRHIADCRTERMGGNAFHCDCGNIDIHYNSCRDRHCPLCQGAARARWVRQRLTELLPCPYFHVVFTVPHELTSLALANRRLFYRTLFRSVHDALLAIGANPRNLGGRLGGVSVLHTWNQKLAFHPHVHCIVPGGVSPDFSRWIAGNPNYLLPVRRLSAVFREKLLSALSCPKASVKSATSAILEIAIAWQASAASARLSHQRVAPMTDRHQPMVSRMRRRIRVL